jgi:hypothetical protein
VGSFLDMEEKQRRMYVARSLGLDPDSPTSWPVEIIDRIISKAEHRADETVRDECAKLNRRS